MASSPAGTTVLSPTPSPRPGPAGAGPVHTGGVGALTALTAVAPATWGTTYLVTSEYLPPDRPFLAGAIRALPVGVALVAVTRTLPRGAWWWRAAVLGTLNIGAFFALLFVAAYRLPGGVAATLGGVQPLLVAGLGLVLLGERPTRWRIGWGVAGAIGVAVMVLRGELAFDLVGVAAGLAGTAAMATGIVLTKRWGRPVGLLAFTGWQLAAGGLLLAPVALVVEGAPPALGAQELAGYAWLAVVGTLLAYTLWFQGLARLPVAALSFLPLLSPAVATALGWLVLDQSLNPSQVAGFTLALTAIAAAQLTPGTGSVAAEPLARDQAGAVRHARPGRRRGRRPWPGSRRRRRCPGGRLALPGPPHAHPRRCPTMNITVIGAAGNVGRRVVAEALARDHRVTAVVRSPARAADVPAGAEVRVGDAGRAPDVARLSAGQEVVVSATRPAPGHEGDLVAMARTVLAGIARSSARLLVVGGAGSLTVPGTGGTMVIDDPRYLTAPFRAIAQACTDMLAACRADPVVDWAYLSPAAMLVAGERRGEYRLGLDELVVDSAGESVISMEDLAVALLDEAERPAHRRMRFTVGY